MKQTELDLALLTDLPLSLSFRLGPRSLVNVVKIETDRARSCTAYRSSAVFVIAPVGYEFLLSARSLLNVVEIERDRAGSCTAYRSSAVFVISAQSSFPSECG